MEKYPKAAKILDNDFYMDDCLSSCNDINEAKVLISNLQKLLQGGGMTLRKWTSNNPKILADLTPELKKGSSLELLQRKTEKTLGIHWSANRDCFYFEVNPKISRPTKRNVFSVIAKIYDPIGWLAPTIVKAKKFIQKLWMENLDGDTEFPPKLDAEWQQYAENLG
jgi:hypothetical protein